MQPQDLVLLVYVLLLGTTIVRGVTGPRHVQTHVLIVVTGLFTPFVAFDASRLGEVPPSAWAFCAAFVLIQVAHTAFHVLRPRAVHADSPEILFQPLVCIWAVALRYEVDPSLWYRGAVGTFFFCLGTLFVSLAVLMLVYMSEGTSAPDDSVDLVREPLSSKGNSAFLTAAATSTMVTLFVVFGDPLWLLAAAAAFAGVRLALRPRAAGQPDARAGRGSG